MTGIKDYLLAALGIALALACLATWQYKRMYDATAFALETQNEAIRAQTVATARKLKLLTEQRDAAQLRADSLEADSLIRKKEFTDALEAATRPGAPVPPVRVRVQACPAGGGSGGTTGGQAPDGPGREGPPATSVQLLPPENSRRLELALMDIELLSRDFNRAKDQLAACLTE